MVLACYGCNGRKSDEYPDAAVKAKFVEMVGHNPARKRKK